MKSLAYPMACSYFLLRAVSVDFQAFPRGDGESMKRVAGREALNSGGVSRLNDYIPARI
jgi:hypothetical protein